MLFAGFCLCVFVAAGISWQVRLSPAAAYPGSSGGSVKVSCEEARQIVLHLKAAIRLLAAQIFSLPSNVPLILSESLLLASSQTASLHMAPLLLPENRSAPSRN